MTTEHDAETGEIHEDEGPRDFAVFLRKLAKGQANAQLSEALQKVVATMVHEARSSARKVEGHVKLTVKLKSDASEICDIEYDIDTKVPKPLRRRTAMWVTEGGNLTEKNPNQAELPLVPVESGSGPARDVAEKPAAPREVTS